MWDNMGRTGFRNSWRENTRGHLSAAGSNRNGLVLDGPESEPGLTSLSLEPSSEIRNIYRFQRIGVNVKRKNISKLPRSPHLLVFKSRDSPPVTQITQFYFIFFRVLSLPEITWAIDLFTRF